MSALSTPALASRSSAVFTLLIMVQHAVCQCPAGWSEAASGKCFRLVPEPYNLRGDELPAFSECPALCGPHGSLACLDSAADVDFVAETLLCREQSHEEWRMPWPLDTTLPTPGACVAAFLGAYSEGNPAKTWLTNTNPFYRVWKCGADARTYNEPFVTTNYTDMISAFNYTGVFEENEYATFSANPRDHLWGEFEPYWVKNGKSSQWRHLNLYGMIAPWRRTSKRWYPTDEYREENYDMRGNVTMVFRAGHMRGPEWSASETEEMNGNDPHAPCLCEYTSTGNATEDTTTGHEELQDLLKGAECAIGNLNWRCGLPLFFALVGFLLLLPILLAICCTVLCTRLTSYMRRVHERQQQAQQSSTSPHSITIRVESQG